MVFLNFALLGLVVGLVLGGSFAALGRLEVRMLWLAYAAVALQVVAFPSGILPWSMPSSVASPIWMVSYVLLIALVVANRRLPGVALVGLGIVSNLVAILSNGGLMPATDEALRGAGIAFEQLNNSVSNADPNVAWLVDRWASPHWLPFGNVYSVGDVIIGAGLLIAIVAGMRPRVLGRLRRAAAA